MNQPKKSADHDKTPPKESNTQTRRSALKKIALGGGIAAGATALPTKWTKPIADRVLVPVHAQTSPEEDEFEGGASGPDQKMGTLGIKHELFIIGTVIAGFAYLQFVSRYPYEMGAKGKFEWLTVSTTASTTTPAPTTTCGPIPTGYHYQYKADAPVTAKRKAVSVEFVTKHPTCEGEGNNHGNVEVLEYVPMTKLRVLVWGLPYTLDPVNPAALPGLTKCCNL